MNNKIKIIGGGGGAPYCKFLAAPPASGILH